MSSTVLNALHTIESDKHNVGNINSKRVDVVNQGAKLIDEKTDNYVLVTLGYEEDGDEERTMTVLTDTTKKGYLLCDVEDYLEEYGEDVGNFYLVRNERGRVAYQYAGFRFEASNYSTSEADLEAHPIKNGQKVYYDASTKKYVICNGDSDPSAYATAGNKYEVCFCKGNILDGKNMIRFEVQA